MTSASPSIPDRICALVVLTLAATELLYRIGGVEEAGLPARGLALLLMVVVLPRFGLREWAMTGIGLAMAGALALRPDGWSQLAEGVAKGGYFAAFILVMTLLREAAITSASVLAVGEWITRQPPGRRFYATWFGGHIAGILLNFGAVSLLAPLIQRGAAASEGEGADEARRVAIVERRQLSALIRGFSMVITWAPTTLTQVIILASVPGLTADRAIMMGLALSAVMLVVARAEDRLRWPRRPRVVVSVPPFPKRAAIDLAFVYLLLVGGAVGIQRLTHGSLPEALMAVAPMILVGWVLFQAAAGTPGVPGARARLAEIVWVSVPAGAVNAFLLGMAGFIGTVAAHLAPVDVIAVSIEHVGLPEWAIVAALPVVITLGGQVALSPMVMVVFLSAVIASLPELPARPEYIAVALGAGWALSMTASPNATGALLLSAATGKAPTVITWRWNGVYSLAVLVVLAGLAWVFVGRI